MITYRVVQSWKIIANWYMLNYSSYANVGGISDFFCNRTSCLVIHFWIIGKWSLSWGGHFYFDRYQFLVLSYFWFLSLLIQNIIHNTWHDIYTPVSFNPSHGYQPLCIFLCESARRHFLTINHSAYLLHDVLENL